MSPLPIVLDCDPGHDDAIALLLVLASPELDLLGVTTTYGNQTLEKTTANALRVLELAGAPTCRSPPAPTARSSVSSSSPLTSTARAGSTGRRCRRRPGAGLDRRRRLDRGRGRERRQPVTLVPTGPLTNVARYLERHGTGGIAQIVVMGGAIAEGNMTPAAEFNVWADPEAAALVFARRAST